MGIQGGGHPLGRVDPFVDYIPAPAPQFQQQQRRGVFGVFHDQDAQLIIPAWI
jgi:hypothetical protein